MTKRYLFPMGEIVAMVQEELRQFLRVATDCCNHVAIIECAVNEVICEAKGLSVLDGYCFYNGNTPAWMKYPDPTTAEMILLYGIPSDVSYGLAERVKTSIETMFRMALGTLNKDYFYQYYSNEFGDIILDDGGPEPRYQFDTGVDNVVAQIREGIDNGDWYPEHLRRIAGR